MPQHNVFILSPARLDGRRGRLLLDPTSNTGLAGALNGDGGAPLGEVFSFISALYFRGKLAYAATFACSPALQSATLVMTTDRGLRSPDERIGRTDLARFSKVDIGSGDSRFIDPLLRDAREIDRTIGPHATVVLLGSIATGKYVDPLLSVFGDRLLFPTSFVGRGDMSRGGLLLRSARARTELEYSPVAGAVRHGARPPRLERIR